MRAIGLALSVLVLLLHFSPAAFAAGEEAEARPSSLPDGPDFKAVLSLPSVGDPRISPDGSAIAYTVREADWKKNRYDTEIWLARKGGDPFQLTRTKDESSTRPRWSPDGRWIAFLADRGKDGQIHLILSTGGEARPLTAVEDGVAGFEWSPDGRQMAVAITDKQGEHREKVEETYGQFAVEDAEHQMTHLWVLDVEAALEKNGGVGLPEAKEEEEEEGEVSSEGPADDTDELLFRRLTEGDGYTVSNYRWSPDGKMVVFGHAPDPRAESWNKSDISIVDVATGEVRALVARRGFDGNPLWSPDGRWILFATRNGKTPSYVNVELAKIRPEGGDPVVLTDQFDENPHAAAWLEDGIRFSAFDRTRRRLHRLDPAGGVPEPLGDKPRFLWSIRYARDGRTAAIAGESPDTLAEIYRLAPDAAQPERVTRMTERTADWDVGTREVVQWQSKDGATVEGVLLKPDGFDPEKKHPLLVIIHGGPASISLPARVYGYVYPVQQWLSKGAVILMPNYRGSTGYGADFRALNVRNLGVGDAWDVLSGVDSLVDQGFVDTERMGAMGWSQGGYISAFLTTTTDRFQAISVGAGISNWMTYYVNTDIHPFTRHYLEATPWDDPDVYAKTSPMTYVKDARTPTLIQHGEFDRRVPVPNAYELFQGLQDVGVETRLIIYKKFGHGINKPKERLAAMWHNWQWFAHYLWGEEVEVPVE